MFLYFCTILVVSCSITDVNVTCLYRNDTNSITKIWKIPKWYLNDEPVSPYAVTEYHGTVWRMVYDYSGLNPGRYVFHGKIVQTIGSLLQTCCGPLPEVFLSLTVEDGEISVVVRFEFVLV